MTFAAACSWSLARSVMIAAVGLCVAVHLARLSLLRHRGTGSFAAWALLLAPFFSPGLIVGYGYRNYSLSLVHYPLWNETLYAAIVVCQAVPVGVLLLMFAPPPAVSAAAIHCRRLVLPSRAGIPPAARLRGRIAIAAAELGGPRQPWLAAGAVMFIIAFQEAEVAALMQVRGWPEWLFTRFAGLVDLAATRRRLFVLVAIQGVVVLPVLLWLFRSLTESRRPTHSAPPSVSGAWWLWPMAACMLVTLIPAAVVLRGSLEGLAVLRQQPSFRTELIYGVAYALTAGGVAMLVAARLGSVVGAISYGAAARPARLARWLRGAALTLGALPGLCGGMILALLVDDLFQQRWLLPAYDTPARMLVALTLFLLPRALLILVCLQLDRESTALHAARLLRSGTARQRGSGRELEWRLRGRPRLWALVIVCYWGYLDLMIATISAPPGMEPVIKRLYNFMHFGHIAGLSAMVCVTVATPLLLVAVVLVARRVAAGWTSS